MAGGRGYQRYCNREVRVLRCDDLDCRESSLGRLATIRQPSLPSSRPGKVRDTVNFQVPANQAVVTDRTWVWNPGSSNVAVHRGFECAEIIGASYRREIYCCTTC